MSEVISWLGANWQAVIGVTGTVVMGASIVVKAIAPFTATDKDDKMAGWLGAFHKWLSKIALNPPVQ